VVSTLDYDSFLGFVAIGRIQSGAVNVGDRDRPDPPERRRPDRPPPKVMEVFRVRKLLGFQGLRRFERERAEAGDIVAISGMESLTVGDSLTTEDPAQRTIFPRLDVDPPTMTMRIRVNDGPFAGREGSGSPRARSPSASARGPLQRRARVSSTEFARGVRGRRPRRAPPRRAHRDHAPRGL
jgi:predicted membrane GTPase involved in stress response